MKNTSTRSSKTSLLKPSAKSLRKLKKKAWKLMSIWVRKSQADWKGDVKCVSCPSVHPWNSGLIHAGHFQHDKLDFDPMNIHPQCRNCNYKYNKNAQAFYGAWMGITYGEKAIEELRKKANKKGNYYSFRDMEDIIKDLETKLKNL